MSFKKKVIKPQRVAKPQKIQVNSSFRQQARQNYYSNTDFADRVIDEETTEPFVGTLEEYQFNELFYDVPGVDDSLPEGLKIEVEMIDSRKTLIDAVIKDRLPLVIAEYAEEEREALWEDARQDLKALVNENPNNRDLFIEIWGMEMFRKDGKVKIATVGKFTEEMKEEFTNNLIATAPEWIEVYKKDYPQEAKHFTIENVGNTPENLKSHWQLGNLQDSILRATIADHIKSNFDFYIDAMNDDKEASNNPLFELKTKYVRDISYQIAENNTNTLTDTLEVQYDSLNDDELMELLKENQISYNAMANMYQYDGEGRRTLVGEIGLTVDPHLFKIRIKGGDIKAEFRNKGYYPYLRREVINLADSLSYDLITTASPSDFTTHKKKTPEYEEEKEKRISLLIDHYASYGNPDQTSVTREMSKETRRTIANRIIRRSHK